LALPSAHWKVTGRSPYMLRVHNVPGAFAARAWPVDGALTFAVEGDLGGSTNGTWRLEVVDGRAACEPTAADPDAPVLSPAGLALAWSGAQSSANLRMAAHLRGGSREDDGLLDRLLAPRPLHIRDYF
ncbi:MAG: sterol carrier protein domain-containing protein, partial [Nocardioides sp.]